MKKNKIAYLVIDNDKLESFLYTDIRKVKSLIKINNDLQIYLFKSISNKYWDEEEVYKIEVDSIEDKIKMFKDYIYTEIGILIMEYLAKAKWNSSIPYPENGWHICSVCGDITNNIDKCLYCGNFVCLDCSDNIVDNEWEEGYYCSYECYRYYIEEEHGIPYNPEEEYKIKICNRLYDILNHFEREQLYNILTKLKINENDEDDENEVIRIKLIYQDMDEDELLDALIEETDDDVCDVLLELYENETDERLSDLLDAEAFINNLDPNDPADEWFFED